MRAFPLQAACVLAFALFACAAMASDAAPAPSIPIELPADPATPSPDELVGGWHGIVVFFAFVVLLAVAIALALEATHRHHFWHDCEECYHHYPPPPPG